MKLGQRLKAQGSNDGPEQEADAPVAEEPSWKLAAAMPAPVAAAVASAPRLVANKREDSDKQASADPMQALKERLHEQLMEKLGGKLFENNSSEKEMRATVVDMITQLLGTEAVPLSVDERHNIVSEITDDVLGHGPIDRYLKDPTVSEVMVMGTTPITATVTITNTSDFQIVNFNLNPLPYPYPFDIVSWNSWSCGSLSWSGQTCNLTYFFQAQGLGWRSGNLAIALQ